MLDVLARPTNTTDTLDTLSVRRLYLTNFRNYTALDLHIDASPVILTGQNGAGKTNLLEAVSFLTPGRGIRRAVLSDVQKQNTGTPAARGWAVAGTVHGLHGPVELGTGLETNTDTNSERRSVRVDGKPARGHAELARYFTALWLTPQMDQLFQEGASARRKFLDRLAYSFDAEHAGRVQDYEQAMRERNRLLTERFRPQDSEADIWLSALEKTMAETSVAIAFSRINTVERLNNSIMMTNGIFPRALIDVRGWMEQALFSGMTALEAEGQLVEKLRASRTEDARSGRSSEGAHKTELKVHHLGKGVEAALCSTGEQKALLLSMILAQARAGKHYHGVAPALLLDEVVAHLDEERRTALLEEIETLNVQAWMTGTDNAAFAGLKNKAQFFTVRDGTLKAA